MSTISLPAPTQDRSGATVVRRAVTTADWSAATSLLRSYVAWIESTSGLHVFLVQPAFADELADLGAAYSTASSALFLALDRGVACGTVAVRVDRRCAAEVKRLYVSPGARGRGHADRLLRTAVGWAAAAGASRAWLETLPGLMDPAIALYRRHGFRSQPTRASVDVDSAIVMSLDLRPAAEG